MPGRTKVSSTMKSRVSCYFTCSHHGGVILLDFKTAPLGISPPPIWNRDPGLIGRRMGSGHYSVLYDPGNPIASMGFQQLDQQKLIQDQNQ